MMSFVETKFSGTAPSTDAIFSFQRGVSAHGSLPPCEIERSNSP